MKKLIAFLVASVIVFSCSSIALAASYVCSKCGQTVEVTGSVDLHPMFCEGEGKYCEYCGEIIYGGTVNYAAHIAVCQILSTYEDYSLEIVNNPGETTLNYGDTLKLTAIPYYEGVAIDDELTAENFLWTVDNGAVEITSYGSTCEIEAVRSGEVKVTVVVLDESGEPFYATLESGDAIGCIDVQTITVKAGFFQKLISFFKDIFGVDRTIVQ